MPYNTTVYPYGGGPLGVEVGQRSPAFAADWPVPETVSLFPRDVRVPTRTRQRAAFARGTYGLAALPVWMNGSSRSFRLSSGALRFPDSSFWRTLRDLLYTDPVLSILYASRFSSDFAGTLSTGPGLQARQAYALPQTRALADNVTALSLTDGRGIRRAVSVWDFMTAGDPVFLSSEDETLVFRNLEAITWRAVTNPGERVPQSALPAATLDAPVIAVWDDSRSLSDDIYLPPATAVSLVAPGFDLAGGTLHQPTPAAFWSPENGGLGVPVPKHPSLVLADQPGAWPSTAYPTGLTPTGGTANGVSYFGVFAPPTSAHTILEGANVLGDAHPVDLRNGWDTAGELMRLARRPGENDFSYAGRQQRLWMAASLAFRNGDGPGSCTAIERQISAFTGRTAIVAPWDGHASGSLPADTTRLDVLQTGGDRDQVLMRLSRNELQALSASSYRCGEDLTDFEVVEVRQDNTVLVPGRDWLASRADGTLLTLARPLPSGVDLSVIATGRGLVRVIVSGDSTPGLPSWGRREVRPSSAKRFVEDAALLSALTKRQSSDGVASRMTSMQAPPLRPLDADVAPITLIVSRGALLSSAGHVQLRRLRAPGGAVPTALGEGMTARYGQGTWAESADVPRSLYGPPMDLDTGVSLV